MKRIGPGLALILLVLFPALHRASAQAGSGVAGVVRDVHGTPQMGALVEVLDASALVVAHTLTDDHGRYFLDSLLPGRYELRASAAFLRPALRPNIRLTAGARTLANLTMTAVFEVGAWFPAERRKTDEPADDWQWTLRSSASRPLLRLAGADDARETSSSTEHPTGSPAQQRFAVLSGDGRFAQGGTRQIFSMDRAEAGGQTQILRASVGDPVFPGAAPSVSVNAGVERQTTFGGETRMVAGFASHPEIAGPGAVGLQVLTVATSERMALGDTVMIDAGTLLSAERLVSNRLSAAPFLRLTVLPMPGVAVMYRFAAGRTLQGSDDLNSVETTPGLLSDEHGRPATLIGAHQELAFSHVQGADTETLAVYQDRLPVDALQGGGRFTAKQLSGLPVLADASTGTFRVSVPGYTARGLSVAWAHTIAPGLTACVEGDLGSVLNRNGSPLALATLPENVHAAIRPAASAGVHGSIARTRTSFKAQYRWQPRGTLEAVNAFNVSAEEAYLGGTLRQRLWSGHRLQGLDAVLEASNLLEEGYEPVLGPDGETLFLAQAPRAMQAGLSFSF